MAKKNNDNQRVLDTLKGIRGEERRQHFANGGSLVSWRGGTRTVTKNKRRTNSRKACRGKVRV